MTISQRIVNIYGMYHAHNIQLNEVTAATGIAVTSYTNNYA